MAAALPNSAPLGPTGRSKWTANLKAAADDQGFKPPVYYSERQAGACRPAARMLCLGGESLRRPPRRLPELSAAAPPAPCPPACSPAAVAPITELLSYPWNFPQEASRPASSHRVDRCWRQAAATACRRMADAHVARLRRLRPAARRLPTAARR